MQRWRGDSKHLIQQGEHHARKAEAARPAGLTPVSQGMTPKREMIARLQKIVEGLSADPRYADDAVELSGVINRLKRISKDATIGEVVVRTLAAVVHHDVTLGGRLVDVLTHLAVQHGVALSMHPLLLIIAALGGRDNPDRATPGGSQRLDALLSVLLEQETGYKEALYTVATLARQYKLDATSDMAIKLLEDLKDKSTIEQQAQAIEETRVSVRPAMEPNDDLGWVIKIMLTLASIAAVVAVASRISGTLQEFLDGLDGVLEGLGNITGGTEP